jgi:hypothetical protein
MLTPTSSIVQILINSSPLQALQTPKSAGACGRLRAPFAGAYFSSFIVYYQ